MSFKKFSDDATTSSADKPADKSNNKAGAVNGPAASKPETAKAQSKPADSQKP